MRKIPKKECFLSFGDVSLFINLYSCEMFHTLLASSILESFSTVMTHSYWRNYGKATRTH